MHFNEQMIKECEVKSNNDYCTVIKYEDTYVQIPSIGRNAKTVFVKYENDRYIVVEKPEDARPKRRKNANKKTTEEPEEKSEE